jgi:hypothetical protein
MRGFIIVALFACAFAGVQLDIHLVPSAGVQRAVLGLASLAPHNQINFTGTSDPHVTLYLTSFVEVSNRHEKRSLCCFFLFAFLHVLYRLF